MSKEKLLDALSQLLSAIPSENETDKKLDLVLSKLESQEKTTTDAEQEEHLLISEVCQLTRKSRVTVWNWKRKKILIPVGKSGKNPIYRKSDVLNYLYSDKSKFV